MLKISTMAPMSFLITFSCEVLTSGVFRYYLKHSNLVPITSFHILDFPPPLEMDRKW